MTPTEAARRGKAAWSHIPDRARWAVGLVAVLLIGVLIPSDTWVRILILSVVFAALASGMNLVVGFAGLLDLGYVAFYAIGAYFTALLSVRIGQEILGIPSAMLGWLFFADLLLAPAFAVGIALVVGYPTLRVRGDYLAIMTLGFGEIVRIAATNWSDMTNGVAGIVGVPPPSIDGVVFSSAKALFALGVMLAAAGVVIATRLSQSYVGRAWVAQRDDELAASVLGVNIERYRLLAYCTGAAYAAAVGVFFAHLQRFVNPQSFTLYDNVLVLAMIILGGIGTIWGPILGALLWNLLTGAALQLPVIQQHPELRLILLGGLILALIIYFPRGILGSRRTPLVRSDLAERGSPEVATVEIGDVVVDRQPPAPREVMLDCRSVSRSFGGLQALRDVSITVRRGEILAVIGPNGAGKTTFFNLVTGVVPTDSGEVLLDGRPITNASTHQLTAFGIARTFQTTRLFPRMTVLENLLVGGHLVAARSGIKGVFGSGSAGEVEAQLVQRARGLLEYVGFTGHEGDLAQSLAHGHRRRIEIARALMAKPELLFLDEPAAGLNATETRALDDVLRRLRDDGLTMVLIEHNMDLVMGISERVVVLDHGTVIAEGEPESVQRDPEVIRAYLGVAE